VSSVWGGRKSVSRTRLTSSYMWLCETYRRTTWDHKSAFCTIVHRAVKTSVVGLSWHVSCCSKCVKCCGFCLSVVFSCWYRTWSRFSEQTDNVTMFSYDMFNSFHSVCLYAVVVVCLLPHWMFFCKLELKGPDNYIPQITGKPEQ